ncbi:MAG: hypothetical protein ACUVRO_06060 [Armatimonadota bacterium]
MAVASALGTALLAGVCSAAECQGQPLAVDVVSADARSITLSWTTPRPEACTVWFGTYEPDGALPPPPEVFLDQVRQQRVSEGRSTTNHRLRIAGLSPSTRYAVLVQAPSGARSLLVASTGPKQGLTQFMRLPVLVVIYTPITYRDAKTPPLSLPAELSEADLAQIRRYMADVRDFYWRNSFGCLDLAFDYALLRRPMSAKDDEVEPVFEKDFEEATASLGRTTHDYTGVIFLHGWDEYADPSKRASLYRGQGFGGLTYGTDAPWKFKRTPHSWIHFHRSAQITWTTVHEYHHQLDALFHASGRPEYPFNHPDPSEPVGVFGEHYDCNAFILRTWPRHKWGTLQWGRLVTASDTDGDGLPNRADVAVDEASFGTDPYCADTDGDGLGDLAEMAATSGVYQGLDEECLGPIVRPNPHRPDTDGDGIPDGKDPYPLYSANPNRPRRTPKIDGRISSGEWPAFAVGRRRELDLRTFSAWDDGHLYFAVDASRACVVRLDIDAANNGWFAGSDNYRITVTPPEEPGAAPTVDVAIFDWDRFRTAPDMYVYWNRDKVKASDLKVAASENSGRYVLELAIPRNETTGLLPKLDAVVTLQVSFSLPGDPRRWVTLVEPHQLFHCRLAKGMRPLPTPPRS